MRWWGRSFLTWEGGAGFILEGVEEPLNDTVGKTLLRLVCSDKIGWSQHCAEQTTCSSQELYTAGRVGRYVWKSL